MKGFDGALAIYQESAYSKVMEELEHYSFNKKENRDYLRLKLASIVDLDVDKMGRVQLPIAVIIFTNSFSDIFVFIFDGGHIFFISIFIPDFDMISSA